MFFDELWIFTVLINKIYFEGIKQLLCVNSIKIISCILSKTAKKYMICHILPPKINQNNLFSMISSPLFLIKWKDYTEYIFVSYRSHQSLYEVIWTTELRRLKAVQDMCSHSQAAMSPKLAFEETITVKGNIACTRKPRPESTKCLFRLFDEHTS